MFLEAKAASSFDELIELGHVPGHDSPHILGYLDPIEEEHQRPASEDHRGMEIRRHPSVMLREDPDLWDIVDRFRCGVIKDLTHREFDELSAWQVEAWLIMRTVAHRVDMRQIKEARADRG